MNIKTLCVIGLGYIGLPTASMFAMHGKHVIGVDINSKVVEVLNSGDVHIEEVGLRALVRSAIKSGNLVIQKSPEPSDAFIIAVPTPFNPDKKADMRAVISASESIVPHLQPGNLVILESTSPARTTVDLVKPILERSGLKGGQDFFLAYSPERVLPGQILKELVENARVIGGIDRASSEAGRDLYATFVKGEIVLTDGTTAEMVKLMENTFRDVNIALANEFALIAEKLGINVWEAIGIANRHPRVNILRPGPGVGGHCIAVDPWFLVESAPEQANLISRARLVNESMPAYVVEMIRRTIGETGIIAALGLTYKADIDDTRESPAVEIVQRLAESGYAVRAYDPHVAELSSLDCLVHSFDAAVSGADLLLVLVEHVEFKALLVPEAVAPLMKKRQLVDTRHCLITANWRRVGFRVAELGVG